MLLDIDHFKQFNDTYGHGAGDDCLRQVAQALTSCINRSGELAARYGGEEFAVIGPAGAAASQAGRLLTAIRTLAIPHAGSSAAAVVTASIGALEVMPARAADSVQVLEQVDRLLYAAKQEGRNRCVHMNLTSGERRVLHCLEHAR
jgi:two-component system chemotaxis family response regulator WspR